MRIMIINLLVLLITSSLFAESEVIRIPFTSREVLYQYVADGYDIASVDPGEAIYIVVNQIQREYFAQKYPMIETAYTESNLRENLIIRGEHVDDDGARAILGYHTYAQIIEKLFLWEIQNPNLIKVINLGPSQGKLYFDAGNNNYANFNHTIYASSPD